MMRFFQKARNVLLFLMGMSVFLNLYAESLLSRDAKIEQELSILYGDPVGDWKGRQVTSPIKTQSKPQSPHKVTSQATSQSSFIENVATPKTIDLPVQVPVATQPSSVSQPSLSHPVEPSQSVTTESILAHIPSPVSVKTKPVISTLPTVVKELPVKQESVTSKQEPVTASVKQKSVQSENQLQAPPPLGKASHIGHVVLKSDGRVDDVKTVKMFQKTAKTGDARAQFNLGLAYEHGWGVKQDLKKAAEFYAKAAQQNHPGALLNLGLLFYQGKGVKQDFKMGIEHFIRSAQLGNATAQFNLGNIYWKGEGVTPNETIALDWLKKSAENGYVVAQYMLGRLYIEGEGVDQDVKEAVRWYERAAAQGLKEAQAALGLAYEKGYGVPVNRSEAIRWYSLAAIQGHQGATARMNILNAN